MKPARLRLLLILGGIAAAGLALLSWTQTWFDLVLEGGQPLAVAGQAAAPALSALGLAALAFTVIFDFPGVDLATILLSFVFLVALGVDYSIFLMSRAREESLKHGTREGVRRALAVTGGVITSAGIVLAATFAALGVIPLIFLAQIAFIVAAGVLIDTIIVRTLLIPGLMIDVGRRSWAPWHRGIEE